MAAAMAVALMACRVGAEAPTATLASPSPFEPSAVPATMPPSSTAVVIAPTEIPVAPPPLTPIPSATPTPTTVPSAEAGRVALTVRGEGSRRSRYPVDSDGHLEIAQDPGVTIKVDNVTECLSEADAVHAR